MSDEHDPELTREELLEKLAGRAKEVAGEVLGNDDLAERGRVQQAEADSEGEAATHD